MGRWLLLSSGLVLLGAMGALDDQRAPDAHGLSGVCETTRDCQSGTRCVQDEAALEAQCSAPCSATASCQEQFGSPAICLGVDLCARACAQASDCPAGTVCNAYNWCERTD